MKGEANLSDCKATPKANKEKIAEILGGGDVGEETVAVVHCNGGDACFNKYDYHGYGNCQSCELIAGGIKACPVGCIGLKSCVDICPYNAIELSDEGYAQVNPEKCVSCGACIVNCPKHIIGRIPKSAKVYIACCNHGKGKDVMELCKRGCIGCEICAKICPVGAISMRDGLPEIDYTKCIGCLKCAEKCPRHCIKSIDMKKKYLLFDLDGTLFDTSEGIIKSILYTLGKMGIEETNRNNLLRFIGPPLVAAFEEFYGFSHEKALAAKEVFRERYASLGVFECAPVEGARECLQALQKDGRTLCVATCKPEHFANMILGKNSGFPTFSKWSSAAKWTSGARARTRSSKKCSPASIRATCAGRA